MNNYESHVEEYCSNDYDELSLFLESSTQGTVSAEQWKLYFEMFWDDNPSFDDSIHAKGWVIVSNSNIVGFLANVPSLYFSYDGVKSCAFASSWYVDESNRGKSLSLFSKFCSEKETLFDTTATNHVAKIIKKKYKFTPLGRSEKEVEVFLPIGLFPKNSYRFKFFPARWFYDGLYSVYWFVIFFALHLFKFVGFSSRVVNVDDITYDSKLFHGRQYHSVFLWKYFHKAVSERRTVYSCSLFGRILGYWAFKKSESGGFKIIDSVELMTGDNLFYRSVVRLVVYLNMCVLDRSQFILRSIFHPGKFMSYVLLGFVPFIKRLRDTSYYMKFNGNCSSPPRTFVSNGCGDRPLFP